MQSLFSESRSDYCHSRGIRTFELSDSLGSVSGIYGHHDSVRTRSTGRDILLPLAVQKGSPQSRPQRGSATSYSRGGNPRRRRLRGTERGAHSSRPFLTIVLAILATASPSAKSCLFRSAHRHVIFLIFALDVVLTRLDTLLMPWLRFAWLFLHMRSVYASSRHSVYILWYMFSSGQSTIRTHSIAQPV